jgi:hypothetical protein
MQPDFPDALLNLALWDQLSPQECEHLARSIEEYLPPSFRFARVATYEVGTQRRHIAHFDWQPTASRTPVLFSLIPGATTTLGFDRAHPFAVDEELVLDWQRYCLECGDDFVDTSLVIEKDPDIPHYGAFYDYLAHILHPMRTVMLQPLLVEVHAEEAAQVMPRPLLTYFRYCSQTLKREVTHINRRGHCSIPQRHVVAFLRHQRFRLLTADEWEYACAAGSRTLFYWVDEQFEYRSEASSWEELRNAFGLAIAQNTSMDYYEFEYCADPTIMKGYDGGLIGYETAMLAFASAYRLSLSDKQINQGVYSPCFRRAYDLEHIFRAKRKSVMVQ